MARGKKPSVMAHKFSEVPKAQIQRSSFDRSHGYKTTFDSGLLTPVFVDEALPGDTFNLKMTGFARLSTPIFPVMDNLFLESFFFAVPVRLLWDNWEKFNGSQDNPGDSTDFLIPTITDTPAELSLSDYFAIPTGSEITYSALWHRAYNFIWNDWFRDENLQNSLTRPTDDGPDTGGDYVLMRRGKRHDYFSSCLPFPQKGEPVDIPLGQSAPVTGIGSQLQTTPWPTTGKSTVNVTGGTTDDYANFINPALGDPVSVIFQEDPDNPGFPNIYADLTEATAATINQLREAFQVQRLLERDARGGTRYTEVIQAHFGVTSPDARLQRPEYLGGGSSPVIITPLAQTVQDTSGVDERALGSLGGVGTAHMDGHGFTKSFTEHCVIIGMVAARADLTYQQGLDRMWSRQTRFDYFWPALAHLGEQAVLSKEIYVDGTAADEDVFGYQERYAEYRYKPSRITGRFRSNSTVPLDAWHLSQFFEDRPLLSDAFIQDTPPVDRVIAVNTEPEFIFDSYFKLRCARPMPTYGVPGMIDHF